AYNGGTPPVSSGYPSQGTPLPGTSSPISPMPGTPLPGTSLPGTPFPGSPFPGTPSPGTAEPRDPATDSRSYGAGNQGPNRSAIRIAGALRHPDSTGGPGAPGGPGAAGSFGAPGGYGTGAGTGAALGGGEPGPRRGRHGTDDVPVVTGVPVGRPTTVPEPEFDVFTPIRRADQDGPAGTDAAQPYPDFGGEATDSYLSPYSDAPRASAYQAGGAPYQDIGAVGGNAAYQESASYGNEAAFGNNGISDDSYETGEPASEDFKGLPRRVRQANLAPQLRSSAAAASSQESAGVPPATAASLTDMRNTLSAMQRGWQQGRSQTQRDEED
ncbi:MAG: hypothetical protein ACRDP7_33395, partial [Trebonia sp.]